MGRDPERQGKRVQSSVTPWRMSFPMHFGVRMLCHPLH